MPIADLANVPTTAAEISWWGFANMAHHRDVNRYIATTRGILLPEYLLDPIDLRAASAWDANHQIEHNNADTILGVQGFDISESDWQDKERMAAWIWLHYRLHYAEAQASGVW
jgi:hypothetical protein